MNTRKFAVFAAVAIAVAAASSLAWRQLPYDEQLVRIQSEDELARIDPAMLDEPLDIQGLLLDYATDPPLLMKAWIALSKYPAWMRDILRLYGEQPEFKTILAAHGESIVPVIQYFRDNDVWTVKAAETISKGGAAVKEWLGKARDRVASLPQPPTQEPREQTRPAARPLDPGPDQRGWYAVNLIGREGHDVLGQFSVDRDGVVHRNQTDRVLKGLADLLASGIRNLETKHDVGEKLTLGDIGWAGLDAAIFVAPLRLLRAGKATATSAKEAGLVARTWTFGPRLLARSAPALQRFGRVGLAIGTVYVVVMHPSLINSLFGEVGEWLGVDPRIVQVAGWLLIALVALYPLMWLMKRVAQLVIAATTWMEMSRELHRYTGRYSQGRQR